MYLKYNGVEIKYDINPINVLNTNYKAFLKQGAMQLTDECQPDNKIKSYSARFSLFDSKNNDSRKAIICYY